MSDDEKINITPQQFQYALESGLCEYQKHVALYAMAQKWFRPDLAEQHDEMVCKIGDRLIQLGAISETDLQIMHEEIIKIYG